MLYKIFRLLQDISEILKGITDGFGNQSNQNLSWWNSHYISQASFIKWNTTSWVRPRGLFPGQCAKLVGRTVLKMTGSWNSNTPRKLSISLLCKSTLTFQQPFTMSVIRLPSALSSHIYLLRNENPASLNTRSRVDWLNLGGGALKKWQISLESFK